MARFDVYRNDSHGKAGSLYLLDIQSNHLEGLGTRIVIPLRRCASFPVTGLPKDLSPVFIIEDTECLLDTV
jgi:toxin CcdB